MRINATARKSLSYFCQHEKLWPKGRHHRFHSEGSFLPPSSRTTVTVGRREINNSRCINRLPGQNHVTVGCATLMPSNQFKKKQRNIRRDDKFVVQIKCINWVDAAHLFFFYNHQPCRMFYNLMKQSLD